MIRMALGDRGREQGSEVALWSISAAAQHDFHNATGTVQVVKEIHKLHVRTIFAKKRRKFIIALWPFGLPRSLFAAGFEAAKHIWEN
jgi:hypothetical protein